MALMLRETALERAESSNVASEAGFGNTFKAGNTQRANASLLPSKTMALPPGALSQAEESKNQEIADLNMNPQELG